MAIYQAAVKRWLLESLVWIAALTALGCAQSLALAQSPSDLARSEFAPGKTGQIHTPSVPGDEAATIPAPAPIVDPKPETRVPETPAPAAAPVATSLPPEMLALDGNMTDRFDQLRDCRAEIASDRHVPVARVAAGVMVVRFTVQPGGGVESAEAVAERTTDPDVLSCARRKIESWLFVRPPGGEPVRVQQRLELQ
jgi:hypothetical protein